MLPISFSGVGPESSVLAGSDPAGFKSIRDRTVGGKVIHPLENWGRVYPIAIWGDFYRISSNINGAWRSPAGRADYNTLYNRFLDAGTGCMAVLRSRGGVFADSSFAQLYVIDVANQKR